MVWAATAVVGSQIVGGYLQSRSQRKAANAASAAQTAMGEAAAQEQREALTKINDILQPYVDVGSPALQQLAFYAESTKPAIEMQQDILGMNGPEAQQAAIQEIETNPRFKALVRQSEEALLQNASATGGLRGGNTQAALAQLRPKMLQEEIDKQYSLLGGQAQAGLGVYGGLADVGIKSAFEQAGAAQTSAANIGNLLTGIGAAQAQGSLASGQATANMWGNIAGGIGQLGALGLQGYGPLQGKPTTNIGQGAGLVQGGYGSANPAGTSASQNLATWGFGG